MGMATGGLALLVVTAPVGAAAQEWAVEGADARIRLSVDGDLYAREAPQLSTTLDFNALLGYRKVLAADSLKLVEVNSGQPVAVEPAEDAELRYASGNPVLRLTWTSRPMGTLEGRAWDLYFRTVQRGSQQAWRSLEQIFVRSDPSVLWDTSFEEADAARGDRPVGMYPGGWDKDGETTERVWTDEEARTGKHALKIARTFHNGPPPNTNRPHWRSWPPHMPVRPGQSVRASGWLKAPRLGKRSSAGMMLEFYDAENKRLREGMAHLRGQQIPHDWIKATATTVAPKKAASALLWFSLHNEGEAYCDDVLVTTAAGAAIPELEVQVGEVIARAQAAKPEEGLSEDKVLSASAATAPPTVDGSLDDACWQRAGRVDDFIPLLHVPGMDATTTVRACADEEALYFAFDCQEPTTEELVAKSRARDGSVWEDDSVELFLDTNRDQQTFYQIIVNSRGVFFDQDTGAPGLAGPKWDGPITVAARVHPGRWMAEVKLDFAGLRLAQAKARVWGVNFARTSLRGGRSAYSWARVDKGFTEPRNFGRLLLPFDPTANSVTGRPLAGDVAYWGQGTLPFEVRNRRDRPADVCVVVTREDGAKAEAAATVDAGGTTVVDVPLAFHTAGEAQMRYDLLERPDGKLLYTTTVPHEVPEPLTLKPDHLISYLDERMLTGRWSIGLSKTRLATAQLELEIARADGQVVANSMVTPKDEAGGYAVEIGTLTQGRYELNATLTQGKQRVGSVTIEFDRIAGPFGDR